MKKKAFRKIHEPQLNRRNALLAALHQAKKYPELKDVRANLRRKLKETNAHIEYHLYYNGINLLLGYEDTPHKYLMPSIDWADMTNKLKSFREKNKEQKLKPLLGYRYDDEVQVPTYEGLPVESGVYLKAAKPIRKHKALLFKKPETNDSYIGLELEYASSLNINEVAEWLADNNLYKSVRVMRDGSIQTSPSCPHQIELCILTKQTEIESTLQKIQPLLKFFSVNPSCGFHVHLDARTKNAKQMFHNLVCMQNVLFKIAGDTRQDNMFCRPLPTPNFDEVDPGRREAHYDAISKFAFHKHRTIEVRIHESTKSLTTILKWVKLLTRISEYSGEQLKFGSLEDSKNQLDKLNLDEDILNYVKEKLVS